MVIFWFFKIADGRHLEFSNSGNFNGRWVAYVPGASWCETSSKSVKQLSCKDISISPVFFTARCTTVQSAVLLLHAVRSSVCLSVRLSVTLVDNDYIGWKSWKVIARTISPTSSLFVAQRSSTYSQGNMEKSWRDWRYEKVACWSTKVAISLKRV